MAGLLDQFFGNADQTQALGLLGAGLMAGNAPGGFQAASGLLAQAPQKALQMQLLQAQIAETQAQAKQREQEAMQRQAQAEALARKQSALPNLFGQQMSPGAFTPSAGDMGPVLPQSERQPAGGLNWRAALAAGYTPDEIQKLQGLTDIGKQKVARTVKGVGPDGREFEYQVDEFGQKVGDPFAQYRAPMSVDQGNKKTYIDPYTLKPVTSFQTFQSPDSAASNAVTMRGQNMLDDRSRATAELGTVPSGYRRSLAGGLEFIPGGPADPNAAKKAAPTEFQGKSTTYAARMQDAAKVIDSLQSEVNPSQVAQAGYHPDFPNWMPGGQIAGAALAGANRLVTPEKAQMYRQAQENWVTANLRQESGAAIGKDEMAKDISKWFPQPGEPASVIKQKAAARKVAERAMFVQAGPGATSIPGILGGGGSAAPSADQSDPLGIRR